MSKLNTMPSSLQELAHLCSTHDISYLALTEAYEALTTK